MANRITIDVDEARAVIDGWLTKAYPRAWQREYVANGIVNDLKDAGDPKTPDEITCPDCGGYGVYLRNGHYVSCRWCGGSGGVSNPNPEADSNG